jgi:hypothetical protein
MSKREKDRGFTNRLLAKSRRLMAVATLVALVGCSMVVNGRFRALGLGTARSLPRHSSAANPPTSTIGAAPVGNSGPAAEHPASLLDFPCLTSLSLQAGSPQAPTNLVAAPVSVTQVNLAWTPNGSGNALFSLEREVQGGSFSVISIICPGINAYSDTSGLLGGATYIYRVRAENSAGQFSAYSNLASAVPLTGEAESPPPPAPPVVSASVVSGTQINLSWTESTSPVDGFFIERQTGSSGTFTQIAQTAGTTFNYSDSSLVLGTSYFYRMRAFINNGPITSYSNEVSAMTFNVPAAPTSVAATAASSSQINLSWTESTSLIDGFTIERETTTGGTFAQIASIAGTAATYSDTDPALQPQTSYTYRMRAFSNITGFSAYSSNASATTDTSIPAPTSLAITSATGNEVDLSWSYSGSQEDDFDLERQVGASGTYVQIATLAPGTTTFADTDIAPNTAYYYRIRALSASLGNSAYSNVVNVTTPTPPAAPSDLTATDTGSTINLQWQDNSTNDDGIYVWRQVTSQGSFVLIATLSSNATSYSDTGLEAGTTYYYEVQAFSASLGNSAFSNQAGATAAPNPAPTISSISPAQGVLTGGTSVTIAGMGFLSGVAVTIGGTPATNISVGSATSITATTPAGALGAADVVVTNTDGQSATLSGGFTYVNPAPTVSSISPNSGPVSGGTSVTITGTGFATSATVSLGGTAATGVTVVSATSITATTASSAAGPVSVVVTNTDGQGGTLASGFTYLNPAPTVSSISPNSGLITGGTSVTITGAGFLAGATVTVGGTAATGVTVASATSITVTIPAHGVGAVSVVVTNTDGQSGTLTNGFIYKNPAPTISSISPASGGSTGGTVTTITGSGFLAGATVTFGGTAATNVTVTSGTSISATTPAVAAGAVSVVVTNTDAQSATLASGFTFVNSPTVTSISPATGLTTGGLSVTITGSNFLSGATVTLGGTAATSVSVTSSTQITAKTPAHAAGVVSVIVTDPGGLTGPLTNGFTYTNPAPTVTSISPASGPIAGGTAVTITGTGFLSGATVKIGGVAATGVTVAGGTSITATTAANSSGTTNVVVTNTDGQSGTLLSGFTYVLIEDTFTGTALDTTKWTQSLFTTTATGSVKVTIQSNELKIGPVSAVGFDGIESKTTYNFTGAYCYVQVAQAFSSSTQEEAVLSVGPSSSNWYSIEVEGSSVICKKLINGAKSVTTLSTTAYSSTNDQFLRIRHDTGTGKVFFESAPNSGGVPGSWTTIYSEAWNSSVTLTTVLFEIKGGVAAGTLASDSALFDNFRAAKP